MLLVQHQCFFQQRQVTKQTPFFGQGWGLQQNVIFYSLCFAKCEKLSLFCCWPFFGQSLVDVQKHCKIRISAHLKSPNKLHIHKHYRNSVFIFAHPTKWVYNYAFTALFSPLGTFQSVFALSQENTPRQGLLGGSDVFCT